MSVGYDSRTTGLSIVANIIEKVHENGADVLKLQIPTCEKHSQLVQHVPGNMQIIRMFRFVQLSNTLATPGQPALTAQPKYRLIIQSVLDAVHGVMVTFTVERHYLLFIRLGLNVALTHS